MRYALIGAVILIGVMVFTIVDILVIDRSRVRHLPKWVWLLLTVALSVVGSALWFTLGRERVRRGGSSEAEPTRLGPDDDPEFLRKLEHDKEREERIRELERKLAELDDDQPKP